MQSSFTGVFGVLRVLLLSAMVLGTTVPLAMASEPNPAGFSFTMPGSVEYGSHVIVRTSVNGWGSEGADPIPSGLQLVRAWFDHYGWTGYPCLIDDEIMDYTGVPSGGPAGGTCQWGPFNEFSSTWFGPPSFEFVVTGCGEGSLAFSVLGAQHKGPFPTPQQRFGITGCATAGFDGPADTTVCLDQTVTFEFTGIGDLVDWEFGDGTTACGRTVSHQWHETGTYTVTAHASSGTATATETETYTVRPCAVIVGAVTASDTGEPLVGATVIATDGSGSRADRTDPPGAVYLIHAPAPGSYDVAPHYPGYAGTAAHVDLPAGPPPVTRLDLVMTPDEPQDDADHRLGDQPDDEDDPVNAGTGNLHLTRTVCEIPATPLVGFRFALTYNSLKADDDGPVGYGWTHSWAMEATLGATSASVTFPDGHVQRFERGQAGDPWTPAGGATDTVLEDTGSGGILLHIPGGLRLEFDASGNLLSLSGGPGDTMTVTHTATRVDHVTDPGGRQFDFTYDVSGRLTAVRCAAVSGSDLAALSYDAAGNLVTITDPLGHSWQFTYDGSHRLLTAKDRRGGTVLTVTYDAQGRAASETDALGNTTTFSRTDLSGGGYEVTITPPSGRSVRRVYNASGRLVAAADGLGRTARYAWEDGCLAMVVDKSGGIFTFGRTEEGALESVTGPGGGTATLQRDGSGRPDGIVHASGHSDRFEWDTDGRPVRLTSAGGEDLAISWNADGRIGEVRNSADPASTRFGWTSDGRLETLTDPLGNTATWSYDAAGRVDSLTRPDSLGTVTFSRDLAGNLQWVQTPEGRRTSFVHDAEGNVTSRTYEPTGATTAWTYDAAGRLVTIRDALGGETSLAYDDDGNLVSRTDPDGVTISWTYDGRGAPTDTTLPGGGHRLTEYDANGRVTAVVEPGGERRRYEWDAGGRITATVDPLGNRSTVRYENGGLRVVRTDPLGRERTTLLTPDGRVRVVRLPDGSEILHGRDSRGRLVALTDGAGSTWRWTYDAAGHVTSATNPDGTVERYSWDAAGRMTARTLPDGRQITWTYDGDDRVTSMNVPGGAAIAYASTESTSGETRTASSGSETVTDRYDLLGRPVEHTGIWGNTMTATWTPGGRLDTVTYPGNLTVDYRYDPAGRLERIVDWDGNTTVFTRDAAGRVTTVDRPGGVRTEYGRDARGLLTSIRHSGPGDVTLLEIIIARDAAGRITSVNRTGAAPEALAERTLTMDRGPGDRLEAIRSGATTLPVTHDALGNILSAPGLQLSWDALSRPTAATRNTTAVTYRYDPAGDLVEIADGGSTVRFLQVDGHPMVTMDGSGTITARHVWAAGVLLYSVTSGGAVRVHLPDERGNVAVLTDGSGAVLLARSWDAFGNQTSATGSLPGFLFGFSGAWGVVTDPAGLLVMGARFYDPALGQFLSRDPLGVAATGNPWAYAGGDPIGHVDPSGLSPADPTAIPELWEFVKAWTFRGVELGLRDPSALHGAVDPAAVEAMFPDAVPYLEESWIGSGLKEMSRVYYVPSEWAAEALEREGVSLVESSAHDYAMAWGKVEVSAMETPPSGIVSLGRQLAGRITSSGLLRGPATWLGRARNEFNARYLAYYGYYRYSLVQGAQGLLATGTTAWTELGAGTVGLGVLAAGVTGWFTGRAVGHLSVWSDEAGRTVTLDEALTRWMTPVRLHPTVADQDRMLQELLLSHGISWSTYLKWQRQMQGGR